MSALSPNTLRAGVGGADPSDRYRDCLPLDPQRESRGAPTKPLSNIARHGQMPSVKNRWKN
eukprot:4795574-Pyramimonas_sp.AAC.1